MSLAWVLAAVIGLLTSLVYVDQYLGISVFVMTLLCVGTMAHYIRSAGLVIGRKFYLIGGYMLALSLVFALTTAPIIRFWSGLILIVLLLTLAICEHSFIWPKWLLGSLGMFFGALGNFVSFFTHSSDVTLKNKKIIGQIILGLIIGIPILLVAAGLLSSADAVMEEMLTTMFDKFQFDDMGVWVWRLVVFIVVAAVTYGYQIRLTKEGLRKDEDIAQKTMNQGFGFIPPAVSGTILVMLNILYLVFAYVQIRFLFFASETVIPGGYNYAEYARSGFFELVILSVLNTIGILMIHRFTKSHLFNHISLTMTALCTFVMIASSWYKMYLYEQAYGYTQLRLYVYMILAFMILFMALITLGIWKTDYKVIEWSIVIGLCYFLVISYVNVDQIIVTNNVARYEATGELDLYYLLNDLTEDAIPSLVGYIEADPELLMIETYTSNDRSLWEGNYSSAIDSETIKRRYEDMKRWVVTKDEKRQFFEYNFRHSQALKAVVD